jgi:hypothetical protein
MAVDDDCLDEYERWARDFLQPRLGAFRVTDRGGAQGVHDFEADLPDGSVAAIEVTGEVDAQRRALDAAIERREYSRLEVSTVRKRWIVHLVPNARVASLSSRELSELLAEMEASSTNSPWPSHRAPEGVRDRLRDLGVALARPCQMTLTRVARFTWTPAHMEDGHGVAPRSMNGWDNY